MNRTSKAAASHSWTLPGALVATVTLFSASIIQSQAQDYTISARNTSLQIDLGGSTPGLSDWTIGGVNQLEQQWFYYSLGSGAVNSIDTIAPWSTPTLTGTYNPALMVVTATNLSETYANSALSVTTGFSLESQPVGSGQATLQTQVTLENVSGTSQTFHFYQYSHFGLGGASGGQTVQFTETNTPYEVVQSGTGGPLVGTITSVTGGVNDLVGEAAAIYDGSQLGLENGNPAPSFNDTELSAGPGNVNFGYEITATLANDSSITISEIQLVPEPSSLALIGSGILVFALFYWRKLMFLPKMQKKL